MLLGAVPTVRSRLLPVLTMTEQEKAVLQQIAETTKRIVAQQERIRRLEADNQPTDRAVELLYTLLDSMHVRQQRLDFVRTAIRTKKF